MEDQFDTFNHVATPEELSLLDSFFLDNGDLLPDFMENQDFPIVLPQTDVLVKEEPQSPGHSSSDFSEPSSPDSNMSIDSVIPLTQQLFPLPNFKPKTTSLKRSRETTAPSLNSEQMRKLSGNGLETLGIVQKKLSADEERQLKRQRRLIKNRESAQKSRQRKKMYMEELEMKVAALSTENERLQLENKSLKDDVSYLTNVIKKTPGISPDVFNKKISVASPRSVKTAGVCLLIVLFSFGLFFNSKPITSSLPFETNLPRELIPEVIPEYTGKSGRYSGQLLNSFRDSNSPREQELLEIFPDRGSRRAHTPVIEEFHYVPKLDTGSVDAHPSIKIEQEDTIDDEEYYYYTKSYEDRESIDMTSNENSTSTTDKHHNHVMGTSELKRTNESNYIHSYRAPAIKKLKKSRQNTPIY